MNRSWGRTRHTTKGNLGAIIICGDSGALMLDHSAARPPTGGGLL